MVPKLEIAHLVDHSDHRPVVARWIHEEWWSDKEGHSVDTMTARLSEASDRNAIPLSLVALLDGAPVGTVNLVANDNDERPDLTPWLAALLVLPEYRGRGIGSELVKTLVGEATRLGVTRMYLGTDIPEFYTKLGAEMHEVVASDYCIMRIRISS